MQGHHVSAPGGASPCYTCVVTFSSPHCPRKLRASGVTICLSCLLFPRDIEACQAPVPVSIPVCPQHFPNLLGGTFPSLGRAGSFTSCCPNPIATLGFPATSPLSPGDSASHIVDPGSLIPIHSDLARYPCYLQVH